MEITEKTVCRFYIRRPKKKKEAQATIRDIGEAQREVDIDKVAEKLGAESICRVKNKNNFFPLPFSFLSAMHQEIVSAIKDLNGQAMPLSEAIARIKAILFEHFEMSQIKVYIDFNRQILFLDIAEEAIDYTLFHFEPQ